MATTDQLEVELLITDDGADVVLSKNKQKLNDFVKETQKAQPNIKFKVDGSSYIDLDKLEKRANETRKNFEAIAKTRLDNGQIGVFTKEVVRAQERSRQLSNDIASIKKELSNPNRKSSIAFLTEELQAAEREADQLARKLNTLPGGATAASTLNGKAGANNLKLSAFQKQNLSYQINDVATMAAMGANPTQIIASQAGQIAQIFSVEQITAFTAKYAALIPILAAGSAAIGITYKITGDIRAEAERRLKTEEKLSVEYGKQVSAGREIWENYRKQGIEAQRNFEFAKYLSRNNNLDSLETLRQRQKTLEVLGGVNSKGTGDNKERGERQLEEARQIRDLIRKLEDDNKNLAKNSADNAMRLVNEGSIRQMEMNKEAEKRRIEAAEKFKESAEKAKEKVVDLFDTMAAKSGANNPFFNFFSEADKNAKTLRETTKGLTADVVSMFDAIQEKQNNIKLFDLRLNNKLEAFDLSELANKYRNPAKSNEQIEEENNIRRRNFDQTVKRAVEGNQGDSRFGGYFNNGKKVSDYLEKEQREIYEGRMFFGLLNSSKQNTTYNRYDPQPQKNISLLPTRPRVVTDDYKYQALFPSSDKEFGLNQQSLISTLARERLLEKNPLYGTEKNLGMQERLDKQLNIVNSMNAKTPEELAIADRKALAIGDKFSPNEMRADQREKLALAAEREAGRKKDEEKTAQKEISDLKKMVGDLVKLFTDGKAKIDPASIPATQVTVNAQNGTTANVQQSPKPSDTANMMKGTWIDEYQNR